MVCASTWVQVTMDAYRLWITIKLKVQVVVSLPTRVLGTNTGIAAKAIWTLTSLQPSKCDILWVSMFTYKKFMKLLPPWNMVLGETSQCFWAILVFASRMSSLLSLLSEGFLAYPHCHASQHFSFFREGDGARWLRATTYQMGSMGLCPEEQPFCSFLSPQRVKKVRHHAVISADKKHQHYHTLCQLSNDLISASMNGHIML